MVALDEPSDHEEGVGGVEGPAGALGGRAVAHTPSQLFVSDKRKHDEFSRRKNTK